MISVIIAVRDSAAGAFMAPMALPSTGVAVRSFTQQVNRNEESNMLYHSPSDFELWHVANFDDEAGKFLPVESSCICRAKDVKTE